MKLHVANVLHVAGDTCCTGLVGDEAGSKTQTDGTEGYDMMAHTARRAVCQQDLLSCTWQRYQRQAGQDLFR